MSAFWNGFGQGFGFGFGFNFMNWCCNPFFMGYGMGMGMSMPMFGGWGMPMFGGWGMPSNNFYYVPNYSGQSIYDYSPAGGGGVSGNFDELTLTKTENGNVKKEEPKSEQPKVSEEAQTLYNRYHKLDGVSSDLTPEFCDKVIEVANNVNCQPEDLMAIIYAESRFDHTFTSKSNDKKDVYVGLIRFKHNDRCPIDHEGQQILGLDVTVSELKGMSAIEQLEYVKEYIMAHKSNSAAELTLEGLAAMICTTEGESTYYAKKGTAAYSNNKKFDIPTGDGNKKKVDKVITQDELVNGLEKLKCSTWDK